MTPVQYTAYEIDLRRTIESQAQKLAEQQRVIDELIDERDKWRDVAEAYKAMSRQSTVITFDSRQIEKMQNTINGQARQLDVARRALGKIEKYSNNRPNADGTYAEITAHDALSDLSEMERQS